MTMPGLLYSLQKGISEFQLKLSITLVSFHKVRQDDGLKLVNLISN